MSDERKMTYGEKAVGLAFNPSGDSEVDKVKKLFAEVIDLCWEGMRKGSGAYADLTKSSLYREAIAHAMTAQMWAVKAITFKE